MPSGGAPFTNEDLNDVFQDEIWAAMQAMLSQYDSDAEGVIVSGCVVTPNASNFDMTAGIVYLNGEFMRVDAVTNQTFTKYIKASTPTNVTRTFNDAASKTFIIEKKAEVSGTADGGGQEITISSIYSSLYRRLEFLNGSHAVKILSDGTQSTKKVFTKILEIGDWNMDTTATKTIAHGLDETKIRRVDAVIINDAGNTLPLSQLFNAVNPPGANQWETWFPVTTTGWNTTNIVLTRMDGSVFDGTSYDSTSYNRGWITIFYEE